METLGSRPEDINFKVEGLDETSEGSNLNGNDLEKKRIGEEVEAMLGHLGLDLGDLRDKKVLDLGAANCAIAKVAAESGIDSVISLDITRRNISKATGLPKRLVANAEHIPVADKSLDLVISHCGPSTIDMPGSQEDEEEIISNEFNEFLRVLSENGEARISPPTLPFIREADQRLIDLETRYNSDWKSLTKEEIVEMHQRTFEVINKSTQYLQGEGLNIKLMEVTGYNRPEGVYRDTDFYWVLSNNNEK